MESTHTGGNYRGWNISYGSLHVCQVNSCQKKDRILVINYPIYSSIFFKYFRPSSPINKGGCMVRQFDVAFRIVGLVAREKIAVQLHPINYVPVSWT